MAQFVLVNVVVAVLMKKLDVRRENKPRTRIVFELLKFLFEGIKSYDG